MALLASCIFSGGSVNLRTVCAAVLLLVCCCQPLLVRACVCLCLCVCVSAQCHTIGRAVSMLSWLSYNKKRGLLNSPGGHVSFSVPSPQVSHPPSPCLCPPFLPYIQKMTGGHPNNSTGVKNTPRNTLTSDAFTLTTVSWF